MVKKTEKELEELWAVIQNKLKFTFEMYDAGAKSNALEAVRFPNDKDRMENARRALAMADALHNAKQQVDGVINTLWYVIRKSNA